MRNAGTALGLMLTGLVGCAEIPVCQHHPVACDLVVTVAVSAAVYAIGEHNATMGNRSRHDPADPPRWTCPSGITYVNPNTLNPNDPGPNGLLQCAP